MRFASDEQRKAVMARIRTQLSGVRRVASRVQGKVSQAWGNLSSGQRIAIAGVAALGGAALATRPVVSHVTRRELARKWGLHIAAYTGAPIAGALYQLRKEKKRTITPTDVARKKTLLAGAATVGLGSWFGERALLHSAPDVLPKSMWNPYIRSLHTRRGAFVTQHGLPMGAAAIGLGYLGSRMLGKRNKEYSMKRQASMTGQGWAARVLEMGPTAQLVARPFPAPIRPAVMKAAEISFPAATAGISFGKGLIRRPPRKPSIKRRVKALTHRVSEVL